MRRAHFPPERNHLAAHLTMFHHLPPSVGAELAQRLGALARAPAPRARVSGLRSLGRGVALVIESPALEDLRAELADAFDALLTPQDRQRWRPHITIQNKVEPPVARALLAELERDFRPRPLRIAGLAAWNYLGGPWGLRGRYAFRG